MHKRINHILNIIIGTFIGVFIGHGIFVLWKYKMRPELYAMQSAPWYTSILVDGLFTVVGVLIAIVIKCLLRKMRNKADSSKLHDTAGNVQI